MPDLFDLGVVARVDVLQIAMDEWKDWDDWSNIPSKLLGNASGQRAHEIAAQVLALPAGEPMRCFVPVYGVRMWSEAAESLGVGVFCFECNMAGWADGRRPQWFSFDGKSEPSQSLLRSLKDYDDDMVP